MILKPDLDILSLADMPVALVCAVSFLPVCSNSAQYARERNSATAWKKKEQLIIDSPCCGKCRLTIEQSTRRENLIITNTKILPTYKSLEAK